jgi:hypothetical protein
MLTDVRCVAVFAQSPWFPAGDNRPFLLQFQFLAIRVYATGSAGVSRPFASSMWFRAEFKPFTCFASSM